MHVIPKFEGEHFFLSNFYESPIEFDKPGGGKLTFMSGEAAFQAAKYKVMECDDRDKLQYIHKIMNAVSPKQAKYFGRSVNINLEKWETIKVDCMREVVYAKFTHEGLYGQSMGDALLKTGHAMLVEGNTWGDKFWGRCEGRGYNILGSILMEVRGYLYWQKRYKLTEASVEMGS